MEKPTHKPSEDEIVSLEWNDMIDNSLSETASLDAEYIEPLDELTEQLEEVPHLEHITNDSIEINGEQYNIAYKLGEGTFGAAYLYTSPDGKQIVRKKLKKIYDSDQKEAILLHEMKQQGVKNISDIQGVYTEYESGPNNQGHKLSHFEIVLAFGGRELYDELSKGHPRVITTLFESLEKTNPDVYNILNTNWGNGEKTFSEIITKYKNYPQSAKEKVLYNYITQTDNIQTGKRISSEYWDLFGDASEEVKKEVVQNVHENELTKSISGYETVANTLNTIHSLPNPIFHLDLKEPNIVQNDDGELTLIDFGLSKRIPEEYSRNNAPSRKEFVKKIHQNFDENKTLQDLLRVGGTYMYMHPKRFIRTSDANMRENIDLKMPGPEDDTCALAISMVSSFLKIHNLPNLPSFFEKPKAMKFTERYLHFIMHELKNIQVVDADGNEVSFLPESFFRSVFPGIDGKKQSRGEQIEAAVPNVKTVFSELKHALVDVLGNNSDQLLENLDRIKRKLVLLNNPLYIHDSYEAFRDYIDIKAVEDGTADQETISAVGVLHPSEKQNAAQYKQKIEITGDPFAFASQ